MGSTVSVRDLNKSFVLGGKEKRILDGVSFDCPSDAVTALIGPNACGKTTLLRIMAGILRPDAGSVVIDGEDMYSDIKPMRRKVGFVSPSLDFHKKLTMDETLSFFEGIQGSSRDVVESFLAEMRMTGAGGERIEGFSEGQKMVLRIACALMKTPSLLLLDEVTSPLDTERRGRIMRFLRDLSRTTTIVMIDHNPKVISKLARRFVLLRKTGSVMKTGTMEEFFESAAASFRLRVRPREQVHPKFWDSFGVDYDVEEDGSISFLLTSREETNRLMEEIGKYSGSIHSYEAAVVTLGDVYEEWIRMAEGGGRGET